MPEEVVWFWGFCFTDVCVCEISEVLATSYSVAGGFQSTREAYSILVSNFQFSEDTKLPAIVCKFSLIFDFLCCSHPERELSIHDT